ncbi:helix-turn-helix domain-containing protein [Conexibacter sp. SYSU D00693]|uniref:helix-turn-helix domain-containing protein n=1 Tax=Conexibacter sp. SYSU D00693 TaxID=2812560 RepID=UPI00196A25AB|nr:helix-turn-helix domain-containing protein [Conexibacter sp. SYSU D00693]
MTQANVDSVAALVAAVLEIPGVAEAVERVGARPPAALSEPLLTVDDVAHLLGLPAKTVRQYAREGRLPAVKIGSGWRFARAEVHQYLRAGTLAA